MGMLDTTIFPGKAGGMWLLPFRPWIRGAQNPVGIPPFFHPALVSRDLMVAPARDDLNSGWVKSGLYRHCPCLSKACGFPPLIQSRRTIFQKTPLFIKDIIIFITNSLWQILPSPDVQPASGWISVCLAFDFLSPSSLLGCS